MEKSGQIQLFRSRLSILGQPPRTTLSCFSSCRIPSMKGSRISGFTLIELVIVLLVVGILGTIAYPSYIDSVRKSKRASAKITLLEIANFQERFFIENNTYFGELNSSCRGINYGVLKAGNRSDTNDGYYDLSISNTTAPNFNGDCDIDDAGDVAASDYTLTATAIGTQVADTSCATFQLNSQNQKSSTGGGTNCW